VRRPLQYQPGALTLRVRYHPAQNIEVIWRNVRALSHSRILWRRLLIVRLLLILRQAM
jgi:hypothetical protein